MRFISELDRSFAGLPAWVIGRGPSLAKLEPQHVGLGPVIAINQAIERVESLGLSNSLFSMQKDKFFCRPQKAALLVHAHESAKERIAYTPIYVFDCETNLELPWNVPSVVAAAGIAERMGCSNVVYLCCDSFWGDTGTYGDPPTKPEDYLMHRSMVERWVKLPVEWRRVG